MEAPFILSSFKLIQEHADLLDPTPFSFELQGTNKTKRKALKKHRKKKGKLINMQRS